MKLLFDFLPVVLFFVVYKAYGIQAATAAAVLAALAQVGFSWLRHRRVERMQLMTAATLVVLGGLTLALDDPNFIKWKPTLVNWAFAGVLLISEFVGRANLLERMMGGQITLPRALWRRLNIAWIVFFAGAGGLNLYVAFSFDENTWVNFKLFGLLGLTLAFVLAQGIFLARHLPTNKEE